MYKVFVNEAPLYLTNKKPKNTTVRVFNIEEIKIQDVLQHYLDGTLKETYLLDPNGAILSEFTKEIPFVDAAGGLVKNPKGKVLFIFRNGVWDLPKGKLEEGERIEDAALREVEEETGVANLVLGDFLQTTYHVFKRKGKFKLKRTYWYHMSTNYDKKLVPQQEEGISKVKWKGPRKTRKALKNTYENIKLLFDADLLD
ncbi:NUDIX hydrolase [Croceivirga sp. JEA036]|uniref:NUDIX hydrolase n=1 Tax=Croceivirga sp. JEA036 TaxID=2721162 RepID=UPI001438D4FB|nr:NUDIX domain-containing protein [Croceivirga sp. JEA036]NJB35964.1 NUDIX domain-containing protein [Croceivirga sp. JEA036]